MSNFSDNYFNTGKAGLAMSCYLNMYGGIMGLLSWLKNKFIKQSKKNDAPIGTEKLIFDYFNANYALLSFLIEML